jgi:hypothetical protein
MAELVPQRTANANMAVHSASGKHERELRFLQYEADCLPNIEHQSDVGGTKQRGAWTIGAYSVSALRTTLAGFAGLITIVLLMAGCTETAQDRRANSASFLPAKQLRQHTKKLRSRTVNRSGPARGEVSVQWRYLRRFLNERHGE